MASGPLRTGARSGGFSLVELVATVAVLAVVGLIVLPNFAPADLARLDLAAEEVASALRFARAESIRRGALIDNPGTRLVSFDASTTTGHVRVADFSGWQFNAPQTNPLDKKPYDLDLTNGTMTQGTTITAATLTNSIGLGGGQFCVFDASGMPFEFVNLGFFQLTLAVTSATFEVTVGGRRRQVSMDGNGRVTVGPVL